MTLQQRISALITAVGTDIKSLFNNQGVLSSLNTTDKTTLVGAINEVKSALGSAGAQINDSAASGTTTYSSNKIDAQITAAKNELKGGVGTAFDTLNELYAQMQSDESAASALATAVGNRPTYTETGVLDTDLVALYNVAKA